MKSRLTVYPIVSDGFVPRTIAIVAAGYDAVHECIFTELLKATTLDMMAKSLVGISFAVLDLYPTVITLKVRSY